MNLKLKKLHPEALLPVYATDGAACFDLHALGSDWHPSAQQYGMPVHPGSSQVFRTGLAFEIPEGHAMLVFSRSGHGFNHDIRLANCVGVIDSDYRGEVKVKLVGDGAHGTGLKVLPGDRIAQALVLPVSRVTLVDADALSETERGEGGFGSTGE